MAIFYALASPELDVVGLTTVFGNAHTDVCTTNALRLLDIAGRPDIPVAAGRLAPAGDELPRPGRVRARRRRPGQHVPAAVDAPARAACTPRSSSSTP